MRIPPRLPLRSPRRAAHRALVLGLLLALAPAFALDSSLPAQDGGIESVGLEERLGQRVPLDLSFRDEKGLPVKLRDLVDGPTILALVYYNCPNVCDVVLMGIAGMLRGLDAEPIKEFRIVTVSIDETEGPVDAAHARKVGLETIEKPFPPEAWRFLTGDRPEIQSLASSVGYRFLRREGGFDHPVVLIFLAPDGTITHYINGATFLPVEVKLSLMEAKSGIVAPTIARLIRFCFKVEPTSHKLVFDTLKVVATVSIAFTLGLAVILVVAGRRRRKRNGAAAKDRVSAPGP